MSVRMVILGKEVPFKEPRDNWVYSHGFAKYVVTNTIHGFFHICIHSAQLAFVILYYCWEIWKCEGTFLGVPREECGPHGIGCWCFVVNSLGDYFTHKYPLYRAYLGISHGGTLVGMHPAHWKIKTISSQSYIQAHSYVIIMGTQKLQSWFVGPEGYGSSNIHIMYLIYSIYKQAYLTCVWIIGETQRVQTITMSYCMIRIATI